MIITAAPKSKPFVTLFISVWLIFWAFGWVSAFLNIIHGSGHANTFLLLWLTFWTIGGAYAASFLAWTITGADVCIISGQTLILRKRMLGFVRERAYDVTQVHNLRATAAPYFGGIERQAMKNTFFSHFKIGQIAFDYGHSTLRFGADIEEAEASYIVDRIKRFRPQFSSASLSRPS